MQGVPRQVPDEVSGIRVRVWDLPTRLFHWLVAALAVFSFTTGKVGGSWMDWHLRSGYAILTLLLFRIAWGFCGGETARFAHFVRGPRAVLAHGRAILAGGHRPARGHNPVGGWMIVLMLAALLAQASTGLFADDGIATQGPLAAKASNALVERMSALHAWNGWVVLVLMAVHVATIGLYQWLLHDDLVAPMITGHRQAEPGWTSQRLREPGVLRAVAALAAACAFVYWLVAIYPR